MIPLFSGSLYSFDCQSRENITKHDESCSFCRRSKEKVGALAMGPSVSICIECIEFGAEVIKSQSAKS
ncbi:MULTISPECIES: ClpX C4-type zinc finger protein [Bacillaceae]|uniref:ClpX C4-type zinc finger protein n=1 Tax=Bacillaceae TaxID=186817 RepID=UPI0009E5600D|nr:ClpX C4-type zinc finger protein [Caldibacillus thermoamylovorans]AWI10977.1 hypothetical protein CQJ30_01495 [Caldibacillus thermoamylovorans]